jgi:Chromo (CHRromatin Organisation MOdifier) domain
MGRQKLKKSFQYEIKWRNLDHKFNTWVARDDLLTKGFTKLVQQFDDLESSREGAGSRDTSLNLVRKHLEDIGLDGDIAQYNEISGLSGGKSTSVTFFRCLRLIYRQVRRLNLSSLLVSGITHRHELVPLSRFVYSNCVSRSVCLTNPVTSWIERL